MTLRSTLLLDCPASPIGDTPVMSGRGSRQLIEVVRMNRDARATRCTANRSNTSKSQCTKGDADAGNASLAEACERSTEFHFPDLDYQLASIQETINRLGPRQPATVDGDTLAVACPAVDSDQSGRSREPAHGDVYITKHSNLAGGIGGLAGGGGGISVIFHLVQDESPDQDEGRIRSGTPLHCSLSAILRACFDYDITTLSMPLLLVPSLREVSLPENDDSHAYKLVTDYFDDSRSLPIRKLVESMD
ncbi:hypothetical protein X801_09543 [Opisthorchis viverrini]|uniref:Uncharacterized protein n=1 Tax=Opisthorchis viverrini TaxID=6198 RepID=A0A1S8WK50_OPIVI|nr:hypothetical protein X801_09543 [Opisthorchis viverrini]